ncbi:MAG: DUF1292 domain-containing protein [Clostridia bacterium]|nr:DUF1292 domain-containing protein [Clostridia bacterium]
MEENNILTFYDENDEAIQLEIVDSFELAGKKYAALATPEDIDVDESEVFIMRLETETSGEDVFVSIENEEELDAAFEMFKNRCGEEFDIID